ncbi:glycosyltransferase family 4 protein [Thalassobaculum sp.]|uniref:glycosyltransferase family 4 protein n=1 Tax=Thalassobaculum sp. TaxID=2022740 RepID=UPI0032EF8EFB
MQLPVIPLGVDTPAYTADPPARTRLRARIGASKDDIVLLTLGRLTPATKAHPVPMLIAAERAAAACAGRGIGLHHVFVGQQTSSAMLEAYRTAAATFTDKARVHMLDGQDAAIVHEAWHGADVFFTLSDNLQETFGLAPIEAMAAGLPCVVSDWNGYRDTVVEGETGFRIPTLMPAPGDGRDLAGRYRDGEDDYSMFHARACMATACNVERAAAALQELALNPDLRHRMGAAARHRARTVYDWRLIVGAYQDLWADLAEIRAASPAWRPVESASAVTPDIPDPFQVFQGHPTATLHGGMTVRPRQRDVLRSVARLTANTLNTVAVDRSVPRAQFNAVLETIAGGAITVNEIEQAHGDCDGPTLRRFLLWLYKFDVITIGGDRDHP